MFKKHMTFIMAASVWRKERRMERKFFKFNEDIALIEDKQISSRCVEFSFPSLVEKDILYLYRST